MTLTQFEIAKIKQNRIVVGALITSIFILFGLFLIGYHYSQENMAARSNSADGYVSNLDKTIKKKYAGDLTDDKIKHIISDYIDLFQNNLKDDVNVGPFYPFYLDIATAFVSETNPDIYLTMIDKEKIGTKLSIDELAIEPLAKKHFKTFDRPLQLGNYVPWTELYKVTGYLSILISILAILVCSVVFSDDTSKNMNQMLLTTKYGRNKSPISKLLAGILVSISLFIVIHVINMIVFACMHDISGWKTSIQANFSMKLYDFPMAWNHLQVYFWFLGLQLIGVLFIVALSLLVSSLVQTPLAAFATATGLYLLPNFLLKLVEGNTISKYLYLFPINQTNVKIMLLVMSDDKAFLYPTIIGNSLLAILFLGLGQLLFMLLTYRHMKYWQFR